MRRRKEIVSALCAIIAGGTLAVAVAGFQGRGGQEGPKVARIEKVKDNLYYIFEPASGGNTAAFVTDSGVVLVDAKNPGWGQEILRQLHTVTDKPVTTIINTHTHRDHTGSNTEFPATVEFVAQENTRNNMAKETCTALGNCQSFKGENAKYLPKKTFKDKMTMGSGKDRIDLYYFGPGHTNGDAIIVFPMLRVAHFADLFARKAVPNVMPFDGGSDLAAEPASDARESRRGHQGCRHRDHRPQHADDVEGCRGVRRVPTGVPHERAGGDESQQERG